MILYNYFRSSASYRVRIALNIKGLAFEYRPIHLLNNGGEQLSDSYSELNPSREVPTLIHDGRTIAQSVAILDYLDDVHPTPRLFPETPYERALVLQACEIVNSGTQPLGNLKVLNRLAQQFGADAEQKSAWIQHWMKEGLTALENFLKTKSGQYSFGDALSAADCFVVPQLFAAERFKTPLELYPTLRKIRMNCESLEAFKKASPHCQPDTPAAGA